MNTPSTWTEKKNAVTVDIGGIEHSRVTEQIVVLMLNNRFADEPKYAIEFRKID